MERIQRKLEDTKFELEEMTRHRDSLLEQVISSDSKVIEMIERVQVLENDLNNAEAHLKFLMAENKCIGKQLEENKLKKYTETDLDRQFLLGVTALRESYAKLNPSINIKWPLVVKAIEEMEGYKNNLKKELLEGESSVHSPPVNKRLRRE